MLSSARQLFGSLRRSSSKTRPRSKVGRSFTRVHYEPLEQRQLLTATTAYVNDTWYDVTDSDTSPTIGNVVDDRLDTGGSAKVSRNFEDVQVWGGLNSAAYDDIQQAIDEVDNGGAVYVLPGDLYLGDITIDKDLVFQADFNSGYGSNVVALNGDLVVDGSSRAAITTGTAFGTLDVNDLELNSNTRVLLKGTASGADLIDVNGTVDLGGAQLRMTWSGAVNGDVLLIDNDGIDAVTGTFAGLTEGSEVIAGNQKFWITYQGGDGNDVALIAPTSSVAGRQLFYNYSKFDGYTSGVSTSDDSAIATDKSALLPVTSDWNSSFASFANVSSYSRGINGIMVDIAGSHPNITADDFDFQVGTGAALGDWTAAPSPTTVSVRSGAGVGGADRVEIIWADGAIKNTWLRVSVLSTIDTGIAKPDVFIFGNRVGDTGLSNSSSAAITSAADELAIRNNTGLTPDITNIYDIDRSGVSSAADQLAARNNVGVLFFVDNPRPVDSIVGPKSWTPGVDVTLVASPPRLADGTLDSSIIGMDFYQDVNGNGVLDSSDVLVANGTAVYQTDGANTYLTGWKGVFDPGDLVAGSRGIIPVPLNSAGRSISHIVFMPSADSPITPPGGAPVVEFDLTYSDIEARTNVDVIHGSVQAAVDTSTSSTSLQEVYSSAQAGWAGSFPYPLNSAAGQAYASAYSAIGEGNVAEAISVATSSIGIITDTNVTSATNVGGSGQFENHLNYSLTSPNSAVGTPVNLTFSIVMYVFAEKADNGLSHATVADGSVEITVGGGGNYVADSSLTQFADGAAELVFTVNVTAKVGDIIAIEYETTNYFGAKSQLYGDTTGPTKQGIAAAESLAWIRVEQTL